MPRLATSSLLLVCLALTSVALPACSSGAEDPDQDDGSEDAIVVAEGGDLARVAADMADRIAKRDHTVLEYPISNTAPAASSAASQPAYDAMGNATGASVAVEDAAPSGIPSTKYGQWNVALVADQTLKQQGFLFLPTLAQTDPARGSFVLGLVGSSRQVLALAAYVPDAVPNASQRAQALLADAKRDCQLGTTGGAGGVTTKDLKTALVKTVIQAVREIFVAGAETAVASTEKAAIVSEARLLARKVSDASWKSFATFFADQTALKTYLTRLANVRAALKGRRITLVETSSVCSGAASAADCARLSEQAIMELDLALYDHTGPTALAFRATGHNAALVAHAIKLKIPVVLNGVYDDAPRLLRQMAQDAPPFADALRAVAADAEQLKLVSVISPPTSAFAATDDFAKMFERLELSSFAPLFAVADDAISIEIRGSFASEFTSWLSRFKSVQWLKA